MGYNLTQWQFFEDHVFPNLDSIPKKRMLELGNQWMKKTLREKLGIKDKDYVAKAYFKKMGFKHTSVDINGEDGAIQLDLTKPIVRKDLLRRFNIVTNNGTSEHIPSLSGQYVCFSNIHVCTKKGGMIVCILPEVGSFPKHCPIHYTVDFFYALAAMNTYKIVKIKRIIKTAANRVNIGVVFIKERNCPFTHEANQLLKHIRADG